MTKVASTGYLLRVSQFHKPKTSHFVIGSVPYDKFHPTIRKNSLTGRLKELLTDISPFIDNASEDQKQNLLSVLDDLRKTNRRKHHRKPCSITVNYSTLGDAFKGLVKDISAGGMFILSIETAMAFSVGQELIVNFPTPIKKQKQIEFPGKVVWTVPKGIGVKFKAKDQNLEAIMGSL